MINVRARCFVVSANCEKEERNELETVVEHHIHYKCLVSSSMECQCIAKAAKSESRTSILFVPLVHSDVVDSMDMFDKLIVIADDILRFDVLRTVLLEKEKPIPQDEKFVKDRLLGLVGRRFVKGRVCHCMMMVDVVATGQVGCDSY